jgi:16S rRNA (uracil1498-N3)-methyltransferase
MESLKGLTVGIPVTQDTDRLEWFIEKAIEMGVIAVQLIQTEWSVPVKFSIDRLRKIAIAAMKQSQRAWLPEIQDQINCQSLLELYPTASIYFAHCQRGEKKEWCAISKTAKDVLLIGPEGDFSPKEVELLLSQNATAVSLGAYRLRTETAALAAVAHYYLSK